MTGRSTKRVIIIFRDTEAIPGNSELSVRAVR
jgi:hypothetical protein